MNTLSSLSQNATLIKTNAFIRSVYNWMAIGLALTGFTSYQVFKSETARELIYNNSAMPLILIIALFVICGFLSVRIHKMQATTATGLYVLFTIIYGIALAPIFMTYTAASIASTFFVASATFITASAYGMITKKDLTGLGQFLIMGVIGLIFATIINWVIGSTAMETIISGIGVLIFTGLTAYDTQKLKDMSTTIPDSATGATIRKGAIRGAFTLYLDFILIFQYLLHFLGISRD